MVTFNEDKYTVEENAGQVSVSLRIDGKFFYPVWAVVEIRDGTATGDIYMNYVCVCVHLMKHTIYVHCYSTYISAVS